MRYRTVTIFVIFLVSLLITVICPITIQANDTYDEVIQIIINNDDCLRYWNGSNWVWQINSTYHTVGHQTANATKHGLGLRFTNIPIPDNSEIIQAHLKIISRSDTINTMVRSKISGEAASNATAFSNQINFETRLNNKTQTIINWDNIPAWSVDTVYTSPDIKNIIQEITKLPGWKNGNSIVIFWEDFDGRSDNNRDNVDRRSYSYDTNPTKSISLCLTWMASSVISPNTDRLANAPTPLNPLLMIIVLPLVILVIVLIIVFIVKKHKDDSKPVPPYVPSYVPPDQTKLMSSEEFTRYVMTMHWSRFEEFIGDLLKKLDFQEVIVTQPTVDHGIDVKAHKKDALGIESDYIIQCKLLQNNRPGEPDIKQLFGNMQSIFPHPKGIFVSPSGFSKSAQDFAERYGITLWDINILYSLYKQSNEKLA